MQTIIVNIVWIVSYFITWPITRLIWPVKMTVDKSVTKLKGPIIIISNHKSVFDPWLVPGAIPFRVFIKLLPIRILATKDYSDPTCVWLEKFKLISLAHYLYGAISITKSLSFEEKTDPVVNAIKKGQSVIIFPEGGLNKEKTIGNFRRGVPYIYARTHALILPCSVNFTKAGTVVNVGHPLRISESIITAEDTPGSFYDNSCIFLRDAVVRLFKKIPPSAKAHPAHLPGKFKSAKHG
ncbi:MAG: lysophospholipid acyltransferase family protein [Candidatus Vogelbacteria bacterium]|nr:lysophospholipid acyltransferase family protein [Candidatus Vogelbacteria bacterium]